MRYTPRPVDGEKEIPRILALIQAGWHDFSPQARYHIGDFCWRLREADHLEKIMLWEDTDGTLVAFSEKEDDASFEWQVHPRYWNTEIDKQILEWGEGLCGRTEDGFPLSLNTWTAENDLGLIEELGQRGYVPTETYFNFHFGELPALIVQLDLPEGYTARCLTELDSIAWRVAGHRACWNSEKMTIEKYERLRRTPAYRLDLDIVVTAPDGAIVACCVCWLDPTNRIGEFEPVATCPEYRGKGLGLALVRKGMLQLHQAGGERAMVVSWHENTTSTRLYERSGIPVVRRDYLYKKTRRT